METPLIPFTFIFRTVTDSKSEGSYHETQVFQIVFWIRHWYVAEISIEQKPDRLRHKYILQYNHTVLRGLRIT